MTSSTTTSPHPQRTLATRENAAQILADIHKITAGHLYRVRMDRPTIPPAMYEDAYYSVTAEITHDIVANLAEIVIYPERDGVVSLGIQLPIDQLDGSPPGNARPALEVELGADTLTLDATEVFDGEIQNRSYRLELAE